VQQSTLVDVERHVDNAPPVRAFVPPRILATPPGDAGHRTPPRHKDKETGQGKRGA
jgi:hypothetical protein